MPSEKIIVVDDSQSVLSALRMSLEKEGYAVLTADDGDKAIAIILRERPDLIISDIQMPNLDGYMLCQIVRSRPETRQIPFIFLTRLSDPSKRVHGLRLGADDFLPKPFDMSELLLRVENILRRSAKHSTKTEKTLSGRLAEFALPDILQMLGLSNRSATVVISSEGKGGKILVMDGRVCGAKIGNHTGKKAFTRLMKWKEGEFMLDYTDLSSAGENIVEDVEQLTMNTLVFIDEEMELLKKLGGEGAIIEVNTGMEIPEKMVSAAGRQVLLLAHKLGTVGKVVDSCDLPDVEVLKYLALFAKIKAIRVYLPS